MIGRYLITLAAFAAPTVGFAAETADRKPAFWASIAEPTAIKEGSDTPLWNKLKPAIQLTAQGKTSEFEALLSADAELRLTQGQSQRPFTPEIIKAASQSCLGPYLHDEGKDWVQFSWVCRVEQATPLTKFVSFQESPELAATVWFKDKQISRLHAMEPGSVPGARRISMGAAEKVQAKQQ